MRNINKVFSLILVVAMILSMSTMMVSFAETEGTANVTLEVDKTEVMVGDIITVTVKSNAMTISSFATGIFFDKEKLTCEYISGPDAEYPNDIGLTKTNGGKSPWVPATAVSTVAESNVSGTVGMAVAGTTDVLYSEGVIFTIQFKAIAAGTVDFILYEDSAGPNGFKSDSVDTIKVEIKVAVTGVTVDETMSVKIGESNNLTVTVLPEGATNKAVTFASDNEDVATVDSEGKVTGVKAGTATITVTTVDGNFSDTCTVTVACSHAIKTPVPAVSSTCKSDGNNLYYTCDACPQAFKADGTTETTVEAETIGTDATNHESTELKWVETETPDETHKKVYVCCGAPAEEGNHTSTGDNVATCVSKAKCDTCGAEYGNIDEFGHKFAPDGEKKYESVDERSHAEYCLNECGGYIELLDHEWKDGVCSECNYVCAHTGGTATCKTLAVCSICSSSYGELDKDNHEGTELKWVETETPDETHKKVYVCCGVAVVAEESHDLNENGVCSECGYGCKHEGGTATCTVKAICEKCENYWGDLNPHDFSVEDKKEEALVTAGDCVNEAVYFRSCSVCGESDTNKNNTFKGDKDANNHADYGTYLKDDKAADHKNQIIGYTGDKYCNECNALVEKGQDILPGEHNFSSGKKDEYEHWVICSVEDCGFEKEGSRAKHDSEIKVCGKIARCDVCGYTYKVDREHAWNTSEWGYQGTDGHANYCDNEGCIVHNELIAHTPNITEPTEEEDQVCTECGYTIATKKHVHEGETIPGIAPTCTMEGYTDGSKCSICGVILVEQRIIPKVAHEAGLTVVENITLATPYYPGTYDFVSYCENCGLELSRRTIIREYFAPALPEVTPDVTPDAEPEAPHVHTDEDVKGFEATCTENGLTDGVICGECGEIVIAQEIISAKGHTYAPFVVENLIEATATENGSYELVSDCTVCGEELARIKVDVPATGVVENPDTADEKAPVNAIALSAGIVAVISLAAVAAKKFLKVK